MGLFSKKNEVREIKVTPNDQYVIWNVDLTDVSRDCLLDVAAGCSALYIVNGAISAVNPAGRWVINNKKDQKAKSVLKLLGINSDKTFDILCGVGGIPYKDYEINAETTVGAHGECKVRMVQPWKVYTTLGKENLTAEDVGEYIRGKLSEIMSNTLAGLVQKYEYSNINSQLSAMADIVQEKWNDACLAVGLQSLSFSLQPFYFNDEFIAKREAYFDNINRRKEARLDRREKEAAMRADAENAQSLANAEATINDSTYGNIAKAAEAHSAGPVVVNGGGKSQFCSKCGHRFSSDDEAFCPVCGSKR